MWQIDKIREVLALFILAISTYTDIKERNIYVFPLIFGVVTSLCLAVIAFMNAPYDDVIKQIFSRLIFPIAAAGFVIPVTRLLKENIGIGDGYLYAALLFMTGVTTSIRMLSFASVFACAFSVFIMIVHMDKSWKKIPFAPFMIAGFIMSLIMG